MYRFPASLPASVQAQVEAIASRALGEITERVMAAVVSEAGRIAEDFAVHTAPAGTGTIPAKAARAAIGRDIRRVYALPSDVWGMLNSRGKLRQANAFLRAWEAGRISAAARVLQSAGAPFSAMRCGGGLDPALHRSAPRGQHYTVKLSAPRQIVERHERDRYIAEVERHLGQAASGWGQSAVALGAGASLPFWKSGEIHPGRGSVEIQASPPTVVLRNHVPYAQRLLEVSYKTARLAAAREAIVAALTSVPG